MIRLLKLILGIPLILVATLLGLVAVAFFATDSSLSGRIVATITAVCSVLAFVAGKRLVSQRQNKGTANTTDSFQFVRISSAGHISVHADNVADAKTAIKELRNLKKSFSLRKRAVLDQQKAIRADYTDDVRRRGSKIRGGGGLGRFVRTMQTISRDTRRSQLAQHLKPLDDEKRRLEHAIAQIDGMITQVEAHILRMR